MLDLPYPDQNNSQLSALVGAAPAPVPLHRSFHQAASIHKLGMHISALLVPHRRCSQRTEGFAMQGLTPAHPSWTCTPLATPFTANQLLQGQIRRETMPLNHHFKPLSGSMACIPTTLGQWTFDQCFEKVTTSFVPYLFYASFCPYTYPHVHIMNAQCPNMIASVHVGDVCIKAIQMESDLAARTSSILFPFLLGRRWSTNFSDVFCLYSLGRSPLPKWHRDL